MKNLSGLFSASLQKHIELFKTLYKLEDQVIHLVNRCHQTINNGGKIVFFGNGGSAADSQHLAAEFVVRYKKTRGALPAIALTTDTSILTANANDFGFESVFSRQVEALCNKADIVIGLTTSGQSPNVNLALQAANNIGAYTVALTGKDGGTVTNIANMSIIIPHQDTARIQEAHMFLGHWVCEAYDTFFTKE